MPESAVVAIIETASPATPQPASTEAAERPAPTNRIVVDRPSRR